MRHVFIINPSAGSKKKVSISDVIKEYCEENKLEYVIAFTNGKKDATNIANKYKDDSNCIIYSVGGDGTLNEVVNGMHDSKAKLSIIPAGSGNDFYKTLIDFDGEKIDLCKVNDTYFINIASVGLDAEVADLANVLKEKRLPNKLVYVLSLIKTLFTYKSKKVSISGLDKAITIFTVCNGRYYGGGFKIDPNAKLNTGEFDIISADGMNKLKMLQLLSKISSGKHLNYVRLESSNEAHISSDIPLVCNVDGEILIANKFDFSIEKEAVSYYPSDDICKYLRKKKVL